MPSGDYEKVFAQAQLLSPDEQLRLLQDLAALIRDQVSTEPQHSIMELRGLGKEIWQKIDVEKYIEEERNSWDR